MTYRYTIDRVEDGWQIFDGKKRGTPMTYYVYVVPVMGPYNVQLILTSYDAALAVSRCPVFDLELYSTKFYVSTEEQLEVMVADIFDSLQTSDIDNPVELAHLFGGHVRSETMRVPARPDTN
jgi:hypothetical protein